MRISFSKKEVELHSQFTKKLIRLAKSVPGGEKYAEILASSAEVDAIELASTALDSSNITIHRTEEGGVEVWTSDEVAAKIYDLSLKYYEVAADIAIALYPVMRLAKRLIGDLNKFGDEVAAMFVKKETETEEKS